MRLLARVSVVLLLVGVGTGLLALQGGGYPSFPTEAATYPGEGSMHLGGAWEWAGDPRYPEKFASMAFWVGINYVMYGMTH